jgi:protoporphyrinogen oxidase
MGRVAIVGAGAMGLAATYHALKLGHRAVVYEADKVPGGMAAHLDFDGLSIERFYHFVCKADAPTFELMAELGIGDELVWRPTSMGYFINGAHYAWGDPISLLTFPLLGPLSKLRYGLQMYATTRRRDWSALENTSAKDWIVSGCGQAVYDLLWRRLLDLKFFEYSDNVSAAWIGARIKRVGTSRRSMFQEELGYIEGGSETLIHALVKAIGRLGGELRLGSRVVEIVCNDGVVAGVRTPDGTDAFDAVISTMPTPLVPTIVPSLPDGAKAQYEAIRNIGVVCVLLKLSKSVTRHFWLNINDPAIEIPGIVEFSNLRRLPATIVYVPYYMPITHPKFQREDRAFLEEAFGYIKLLNPAIADEHLLAGRVGRLKHAQPVCEPGFAAKIPAIQTPIKGLQIADTCYYYPEDRGIAESVRYGKRMAQALVDQMRGTDQRQ